MRIRTGEMTLGGKLSLSYLCVVTPLFFCGGWDTGWFGPVFGFPLCYILWGVDQSVGPLKDRLPQSAVVTLWVVVWVANAYVWGYAAAYLVRRCGGSPPPTDTTQQNPGSPIRVAPPAPSGSTRKSRR